MDTIQLLPEYLDVGVDPGELRQIALAALARRIRELKLAVAEAVVRSRACELLDDQEGIRQALQGARQLQVQYHHFYAEWRQLGEQTQSAGAGNEEGAKA